MTRATNQVIYAPKLGTLADLPLMAFCRQNQLGGLGSRIGTPWTRESRKRKPLIQRGLSAEIRAAS